MKLNWEQWLLGLVAAVVQGGAGAVTAAIGASWVAPNEFNLSVGFAHTMELMGAVFVINGLLGFFSYLAKHPTPEWDGATDRRGANGASKPTTGGQ